MTTNKKIALGALIFLLTSITWTQWVKPFCDQWLIGRQKKAAAREVAQAKTVPALPRLPIERKWMYGFTRPPWIKGKNLSPETRSGNYSATLLLCDSEGTIREFKIFLPGRGTYTHYYGRELTERPHGIQGVFTNTDGLNHGVWFLKPDQQGRNPISYSGSEVDKNGEQMEIWLRAID